MMRDSYENYLLDLGVPIPIIPSELTPDVKAASSTKNGSLYPVEKALTEMRLRSSSEAYGEQLKRDYVNQSGSEALDAVEYVLFTTNLRTISVRHSSPHVSNGGKSLVRGGLHPRPFHGSGITYGMLDRLQPE